MKFTEEKKDIFTVDDKEWTFVHCIAADFKMGAGIAVPIKKKFGLEDMYDHFYGPEYKGMWKWPVCLYYKGVMNLVTKEKSWYKPTYDSLRSALVSMKLLCEKHGIKKLVMPTIGAGLDQLNWKIVKVMIEETFRETDIEILVCIWS